jgi:hypothetical protein
LLVLGAASAGVSVTAIPPKFPPTEGLVAKPAPSRSAASVDEARSRMPMLLKPSGELTSDSDCVVASEGLVSSVSG